MKSAPQLCKRPLHHDHRDRKVSIGAVVRAADYDPRDHRASRVRVDYREHGSRLEQAPVRAPDRDDHSRLVLPRLTLTCHCWMLGDRAFTFGRGPAGKNSRRAVVRQVAGCDSRCPGHATRKPRRDVSHFVLARALPRRVVNSPWCLVFRHRRQLFEPPPIVPGWRFARLACLHREFPLTLAATMRNHTSSRETRPLQFHLFSSFHQPQGPTTHLIVNYAEATAASRPPTDRCQCNYILQRTRRRSRPYCLT